jgi:transcriptional regulator with XRE-family HTH domain
MDLRDDQLGTPEGVGANITAARVAKGWNKATLGRASGVSDVAISYYERGSIKDIGYRKLVRLAEALEVSTSTLIGHSQ